MTAFLSLIGATPAFCESRHVVLLYDERTDLPGLAVLNGRLVHALESSSGEPIEIYQEIMDRSRFDSVDDVHNLRDYLGRKYADKPVDTVVAVMGPALDFLLSYGEQIFPEAPIVFYGIDRRELGSRTLPSHVTGVLVRRMFAPTLELALMLHPNTSAVVVVGGSSEFDARIMEAAQEELRAYEGRVRLTYLIDLPLSDVLQQVSQLPPTTVVLYATMFRDGAGETFVPHDVAARVSAVASVPVYGFLDQLLGTGIVGGHLYTSNTHAEEAGRLTLEVLAGVSPAALPVRELGGGQTLFDARQLDRWGIKESELPVGSMVLFREPSAWSMYKHYILGVVAVLAMQAIAIGGLLVQRARRRRLEAELRASESLFRTMADTAPVMIWIAGPDGKFKFLNKVWLDFVGAPLPDALRSGWSSHVHPNDLPRWQPFYAVKPTRGGFAVESRLRRADGVYRWMVCAAVPRFSPEGQFADYVGSCFDITALRDAELENQRHLTELSRVSRVASLGQLTASVAHEVNQPLAAIVTNSDTAQLLLANDSPRFDDLREILADIRASGARAAEIIRRMRNLLQRHELEYKPVDLDEAVGEVIELLRSEAIARKVMLSCEPSAAGPVVAGDRIHLQQVVMNLVLNAFDALLAVPEDQRRVNVQTKLSSACSAAIIVTDSGPGMPPEVLPHLFESFYTTKRGGLGMGLAIARSIVEAHHGVVTASNAEEGGATFRVTLPLTAERGESLHDLHANRAAAAASGWQRA